jgi:hypothetical protein
MVFPPQIQTSCNVLVEPIKAFLAFVKDIFVAAIKKALFFLLELNNLCSYVLVVNESEHNLPPPGDMS